MSHEADSIWSSKQTEALKNCPKGKVFKGRKEGGKRKLLGKNVLFSGKVAHLRGMEGAYQLDYLIFAIDYDPGRR